MKKLLLPSLYILVGILLFANCVQDISFGNSDGNQTELVISGTFSNGLGPHIIRLTTPNNYGLQFYSPVTGAVITLSDDQNNHWTYQEVTPTDNTPVYYQLTGVKGQIGNTYSLEVRLQNGDIYRASPQVLPEPIPIDSVRVRGQFLTTVTSDGIAIREPFGYAYAYAKRPAVVNDRYLRWDGDVNHIFIEVDKLLYPPSPFPPAQHLCFFSNRISDQNIAIADPSQFQAGAEMEGTVGKRRFDRAFEFRIAFSVYQYTINKPTYEYWSKVRQLLTADGTIFDAPPAKIAGNLVNTMDADRPALGWFEVASSDTLRYFTQGDALGPDFTLSVRTYCQYDFDKYPPVNYPECDDCLILPGATYTAPTWWR